MYQTNQSFLANGQVENLRNRKNAVMADYNNCFYSDQAGKVYIKPGYDKRVNDCVVELQALDVEIARLLQPQQPIYYQQQSMPNVPNMARQNIGPSATTSNNVSNSFNGRLANGIATNQSKNYSVQPVSNFQQQPQQKQTPKVEKPKEKVFINGALPYLDYLVDKNHLSKVMSIADRENTYSYEIAVVSRELLDWQEDDNITSLTDIKLEKVDSYQPGTILSNGWILHGQLSSTLISKIYSDFVWDAFTIMYQNGRKVDYKAANPTVVGKLRTPRQQSADVEDFNGLQILSYPMVIVNGISKLTDKFYRISRDSHNLLYNKLIGLDMKYPFAILGEYNREYGNFSKFLVMKVDEEFGCVNVNLVSKSFVNWLF